VFGDTVADLQYLLTPELWKDFQETCAETVSGETTRSVLDASLIASRAGRGPKPYTVDRGALKNVLMKGIEKDICWGNRYAKYEIKGEEIVAHFEDESTESGTLLVGADGYRSPVRKQYLPEHKTVDTEGVCIYGKTLITEELTKRFPARAMKWLTLLLDPTPYLTEVIFGDLPITVVAEAMRFQNRDKHADIPRRLSILGNSSTLEAQGLHRRDGDWLPATTSKGPHDDVEQRMGPFTPLNARTTR
jgi:2-polyprenyl-6-methoxyphenol hydroxylase-like FAD-dependent oxidoreductase